MAAAPPPVADEEPRLGPDASRDDAVVRFIKGSRYFERMLLFEPIPLLQLQEDLKFSGIRISRPDLSDFCDRKGIVFQDTQSKWK